MKNPQYVQCNNDKYRDNNNIHSAYEFLVIITFALSTITELYRDNNYEYDNQD